MYLCPIAIYQREGRDFNFFLLYWLYATCMYVIN